MTSQEGSRFKGGGCPFLVNPFFSRHSEPSSELRASPSVTLAAGLCRSVRNHEPHQNIGEDSEAKRKEDEKDAEDPYESGILFEVFSDSTAHAADLAVLVRQIKSFHGRRLLCGISDIGLIIAHFVATTF